MENIRRNRFVRYGAITLVTCALALLAFALAGCSSSSTASSSSVSATTTASSTAATTSYRTLDQIKSAGTIKVGVYGDGGVQQAFGEAIASATK